jgi:predicted Zn-dependent protease
VITRRSLVAALNARRVSEWIVVERVQEIATADEALPVRRSDQRTRYTVIVHHDVTRGRGTSRIELASLHGDAIDVVDQAIQLAEAAVGPTWHSTPPAAPAKVALLDPQLEKADLATTAITFLSTLPRPPGTTVSASIEVLRERVTVNASSGFHAGWIASAVRAGALLTLGERSLEVTREARKLDQLALGQGLTDAAGDLALLARATAPTPGPCALVLRTDALLHAGGLGMWAVFADHASAEIDRQGLSRYRLHSPVAPGVDTVDEPLTITSDGALDFAPRSAPVGDEADAVRRFALIDRGVSVGLGLSMREAARRKTDPNGGVRNLIVKEGTWTGALPARRTIDVRRLRSLSIDPYTGDASLEISVGLDRERVITGGTIRLDLVGALARAHRSKSVIQRGPYVGPDAVVIDDVELLD